MRERNLFRSMLSHDIRNPLNVIFNYADMIGDEPGLSAGARQLLPPAGRKARPATAAGGSTASRVASG
ncbi:MAG TPA: histidine kinase dimerization/phospho-acceptor domain-containing protein [Candidatus Dormibacteraeota bacterium]|nr:histidine kinase dimerization/phospho-acceptor domain-containing protein [Candidatus Dormibacteraeota bacterium]